MTSYCQKIRWGKSNKRGWELGIAGRSKTTVGNNCDVEELEEPPTVVPSPWKGSSAWREPECWWIWNTSVTFVSLSFVNMFLLPKGFYAYGHSTCLGMSWLTSVNCIFMLAKEVPILQLQIWFMQLNCNILFIWNRRTTCELYLLLGLHCVMLEMLCALRSSSISTLSFDLE